MKHLIIVWLLLCQVLPTTAQQIAIGTGGQMTLYSGSSLSANGLTLTPTAPFTVSSSSIDRSSTITYPFSNPYVTRVFTFTATPPLFTGDISFTYDESELNGLSETGLQLIVYNGTAWQNAGLSTVDAGANTVFTAGLTNLPLGELILAGALALPLQWGTIRAERQAAGVLVTWTTEQEQQVSHFEVERSKDGRAWTTVITGIPATNLAIQHTYRQTDQPQYSGLLYYRIRQWDLDGRSTLSRIVRVEAAQATSLLQVQPNPANTWFSLAGTGAEKIGTVAVYNSAGALLKSWKGLLPKYELPALTAGSYYLRIVLTTGHTETRKLLVQ